MPSGLQIFNPSGQIVFDVTDVSARVLDSIRLTIKADGSQGNGAGSKVDARLASGRPFAASVGALSPFPGTPRLLVSVSGTTISWHWVNLSFYNLGDASDVLVYGLM